MIGYLDPRFSSFFKVICRDVGALVGALQQIIAVVSTGVAFSVIFRIHLFWDRV
jgi:hypothetical protein